MATTLPPLLAPWRTGDRELIRQYLGWPVVAGNLIQLTSAMNRAADFPDTVIAIQAWIDEIENLSADWADKVADGTAHLGNAAEYEGPMPGKTLTRDDLKKRADVLEWDTSLHRVRIVGGTAASSTLGGTLAGRIGSLKGQIIAALGLKPASGYSGSLQLVRS